MNAKDKSRFCKKVDRSGECHEWNGSKTNGGHGRFKSSDHFLAHRAAWELANGPIPDGMQVLHKCDNPGCCNPDHLFTGTQADNMRDKVEKGRQLKGESHRLSKLTEKQVIEIRQAPRFIGSGIALAEKYGMSKQQISAIRTGRFWSYLNNKVLTPSQQSPIKT